MGFTDLLGLEDFGLRSRGQLASLGSRKVTVDICWTTPSLKALLHLSPQERKRLVSAAYWQGIEKFQSLAPEARQTKGKWSLKAESLAKLPRIDNIGPLSLVSIQGIKRRQQRRSEAPQDFAVLVQLVEEVAGKHRGMQYINHRTVALRAKNAREAKRRVEQHFRRTDYTTPFVLPSGDPVRWRLEKVLEVRRVVINPLEDGITTVWTSSNRREMKRGSGWKPDRSDEK
jgi:hypothetical protein